MDDVYDEIWDYVITEWEKRGHKPPQKNLGMVWGGRYLDIGIGFSRDGVDISVGAGGDDPISYVVDILSKTGDFKYLCELDGTRLYKISTSYYSYDKKRLGDLPIKQMKGVEYDDMIEYVKKVLDLCLDFLETTN